MSEIQFMKMQGIGNDFIMVDARALHFSDENYAKMARKSCDRHYGVGADGLILLLDSEMADFQMRIFNSDGSEPEMCGNGIRCFMRFLSVLNLLSTKVATVETGAGVLTPEIIEEDDLVGQYKVDMGPPELERSKVPVAGDQEGPVIMQSILVDQQLFSFTAVSMGNPHAVVFVDDVTAIDLPKLGPIFETHDYFPAKINTEFVEQLSPNEYKMRVWERSAAETLACGTGACAVVVAGVISQKGEPSALLHLPGGDLQIDWDLDSGHVFMTGVAETVFSGQFLFS